MTEKQPRPTYLVKRSDGYITPGNLTGRIKKRENITGFEVARRDYVVNEDTKKKQLMEASRFVSSGRLSDEYQDKLAQQLAEASPTYGERMAEIAAETERSRRGKLVGGQALEASIEDPDPYGHLLDVGDDDPVVNVEQAAIRDPETEADRLRREREKADADDAAAKAYKRSEMGWRG